MDKTGEMEQGEMVGPFMLPGGTIFGFQVWLRKGVGVDDVSVMCGSDDQIPGSALTYFRLQVLEMRKINKDTPGEGRQYSTDGGVTWEPDDRGEK